MLPIEGWIGDSVEVGFKAVGTGIKGTLLEVTERALKLRGPAGETWVGWDMVLCVTNLGRVQLLNGPGKLVVQ